MELFIGLDIGGTKFTVASGDSQGGLIKKITEATPPGLDEGLELLHVMIYKLKMNNKILRMAAATGGPLDWQKGIVSPLHQPAWREVPLKAMMEKRYGCPFYVDVDTNVAAQGEYMHLKQKPVKLLYITLSTGMGGGLMINGEIFRGINGAHPEIGHQSINFKCEYPERISCECGANDCLEGLVSGNAIRRIYQKPAEDLTDAEWREVAYNFGQGLRNLAAIYSPDLIILGGSVALGGGEPFISQAKAVMQRLLKIVPAPKVRLSRLGTDSPLIGALCLARSGLG